MIFMNIKENRKKKGLSQGQLAEKLNIKQTTMSKWELNKSTPSLQRLAEIAEVLDVSLDDLVIYKKSHQKTTNEYLDLLNEKEPTE